jgi:FtsH-binding integral membrane protein
MSYYSDIHLYVTANVALTAVGTLASFGLWVYGCCLKRSTNNLGRFMTWTRSGLGCLTMYENPSLQSEPTVD